MFRHMVAILRGSWVPDKLLKQCSVLWARVDYDPSRVASWLDGTDHSPHTPIRENIAWVAYQALTTPWEWQPYAKTCRGRKIWNVLIKILYFVQHLCLRLFQIYLSLWNTDKWNFCLFDFHTCVGSVTVCTRLHLTFIHVVWLVWCCSVYSNMSFIVQF
jgi:hypothetical protein